MTTIKRVLIVLDVTPKGGQVVLRALQDWQTVIAEQMVPLTASDLLLENLTVTADYAKLIALIKGLKRLVSKLPAQRRAQYDVVVVQSSPLVHRWLTDPTTRKAALAQTLGGYVDRLGTFFPKVQFEHRSRAVVATLLPVTSV